MQMPTLPKYLIITSDDFGYSSERDAGIVQCFKSGAISCVSLMVNGHSAGSAVKQAAKIGMPMDLHLNLSEGRPVSSRGGSSLTDEAGFMLGKMGFREAVHRGTVDIQEVKQEIQAQIDKFCELTGQRPVKVDGHQHVHVIPGICEAFAEVLAANGIKMSRLSIEEDISCHTWSSRQQEQFMEGVVQHSRKAQEIFSSCGIWAPGFVGLKTMGLDMVATRLQSCITAAFTRLSKHPGDGRGMLASLTRTVASTDTSPSTATDTVSRSTIEVPFKADSSLPAGDGLVCELMVHPGNRTLNSGGCGGGPDDFSQSPDREHEMAVLMSEKMLSFYKTSNISLVAFSDCLELFN